MLKCQRPKLPRQGAVKKNGNLDLDTKEGQRIYKSRTVAMFMRQGLSCALCPAWGNIQFDHEAGRGHGGGHRNDAITDADGNWINAALCEHCNSLKGSKRYKWVSGIYTPVTKEKAA